MKKSIIAAGVIVVLGAGWVGSSWYSGKMIKEGKELYTVSANQQLAILVQSLAAQSQNLAYMMPKLELHLDSYNRGILSSTARYYLNEVGDKNKNERIYFTANIEHGPFPLSELITFNLMPKIAAIDVEMDNTELTKAVFDVTKGKSPFLLKIVPGTGSTRSELTITPIEYKGFKLDDAYIKAVVDNDMSKIESNGKLGILTFETPDATVNIDTLTIDSRLTQGQFTKYIGNNNLKLKSLSVKTKKRSYPPVPQIKFENISSQSQMKEDGSNIQYGFQLEFGNLKVAESDFGTIKFGADLSQIDGNAFKKLIADMTQYGSEIENDPELMQEILLNNMESLLKGSPVIKIAPISWSNKGGISQYQATIEMSQFSMVNNERLTEDQILAKIVKSIDSDLSLSIPMIKDAVVTSVEAAGIGSKADAEKQFDKAITELPSYLKQFDKNNVLKINGDKVESKLIYSNNVVTLNGQEIPLKDFINSLE